MWRNEVDNNREKQVLIKKLIKNET